MNILKRLIIKEWFRSFLAATVILCLLLTVANLISGLLRGNVTPTEVFINYFIELPGFINKIFPVSCLIATLFSVNKLKNRNELTAIFASGYSRRNYILDIILASFTIAILQFLVASYIGPYAKASRHEVIQDSEQKFRNLRSQGLRASTIGSGKIWYKSNRYFFSFSKYDKRKKELKNVTLFFLDDSYKSKTKLKAPSLSFTNDSWIADIAYIDELLNTSTFPLQQIKNNYTVEIDELPSDFEQIEADITTLNIGALYEYISQLSHSGINTNEYLVLLLDKFANSFICIIFALLSSVTIFTPNRRNSSFGRNIVFIFIFTIVYWLIYSYLFELGISSKIHPIIACFSIQFIFLLFIGLVFYKNRKLS